MAKALRVKETGECFRLADRSSSIFDRVEGATIQCHRALLYKRGGKRVYNSFYVTFDPKLYEFVDVRSDILDDSEETRADMLMCLKHHPEKLSPVERWEPLETTVTPRVDSVPRDVWSCLDKMTGLMKTLTEYLKYPARFDRTRLSVLTFEASNMIVMSMKVLKSRDGDYGNQEAQKAAQ